MLFFVEHQGKEYRVRVESRRGEYYVTFGDEPETCVDLNFYGHDCSFLDPHEVFAANIVGNKQDFTAWIPDGNVSLRVESEYRRIVSALRGQQMANENLVTAKMPGKIAKIHVKVGDLIETGAPLMVMEAMKMENEIRSVGAGRVLQVAVKEGQAVESGALLIEIEPEKES